MLDIGLLDDEQKLKEITHWLKTLNWPNGWHYDLDIIWILKNIEELKLPSGAIIVDVGAGLGVTQFILAARGYNVISLDFTDREIPKFTKGIFNIEIEKKVLGDSENEYMNFMTYGQENKKLKKLSLIVKKINTIVCDPTLSIYYLKNISKIFYYFKIELCKRFNIYYFLEKLKNHSSFGKIIFLRATFNNMHLVDNLADALVSVSAFEHNTYEDMPDSVKEFERVLKKGARMLITTSASYDEDWYFEPSKGWNFTCRTLSEWFNVKGEYKYCYAKALERIRSSKKLKSRISPFYKYNGQNGLPYAKLEDAKYVPVGIIKTKC